MFPIVHIGPIEIAARPFSILIMLVIMIPLTIRRLRKRRQGPRRSIYEIMDLVVPMLIATLVGGLAAAVLPAVLTHLMFGLPLPEGWFQSGMHWMGVLFGISVVLYANARSRGIPPGRPLDIMAPLPYVALAIIRIGCLGAGCCYGHITDSPIAIVMPDPRGIWAPRYPTRIASMIMNLGIAGAIVAYERIIARKGKPIGWPFHGFVYLASILAYCVGRFWIEFWRAEMPLFWGPFTWTHVYCVIGAVLSIWFMVRGFRNMPQNP